MGKKWDEYEFKDGDHWIERVHVSLEDYNLRISGSPEFFALQGIVRGIRAGNITMGDPYYLELALKATTEIPDRDGYDSSQIKDELRELARIGLFRPVKLVGIAKTESVKTPSESARPEYDIPLWTQILEEHLDFWGRTRVCYAEAAILAGVVAGVKDGTVRHGDPSYGKLVIDLMHKHAHQDTFDHIIGETVTVFAEYGFFGNELLRGCEPERTTAVSRLK